MKTKPALNTTIISNDTTKHPFSEQSCTAESNGLRLNDTTTSMKMVIWLVGCCGTLKQSVILSRNKAEIKLYAKKLNIAVNKVIV